MWVNSSRFKLPIPTSKIYRQPQESAMSETPKVKHPQSATTRPSPPLLHPSRPSPSDLVLNSPHIISTHTMAARPSIHPSHEASESPQPAQQPEHGQVGRRFPETLRQRQRSAAAHPRILTKMQGTEIGTDGTSRRYVASHERRKEEEKTQTCRFKTFPTWHLEPRGLADGRIPASLPACWHRVVAATTASCGCLPTYLVMHLVIGTRRRGVQVWSGLVWWGMGESLHPGRQAGRSEGTNRRFGK